MTETSQDTGPPAPASAPPVAATKTVLHVGCGPKRAGKLHRSFRDPVWKELRLDIDPRVAPDLVSSIVDMSATVSDHSMDAVWCSHCLEHLHPHEVPLALAEFRRVLKPTGFALITSPDIGKVAHLIMTGGLDTVAYKSPAGDVRPLDMLFGLGAAIAKGNVHMAHHTGFTDETLGKAMVDAGFSEVRVKSVAFDLWAIAFAEAEFATATLDGLPKEALRWALEC